MLPTAKEIVRCVIKWKPMREMLVLIPCFDDLQEIEHSVLKMRNCNRDEETNQEEYCMEAVRKTVAVTKSSAVRKGKNSLSKKNHSKTQESPPADGSFLRICVR